MSLDFGEEMGMFEPDRPELNMSPKHSYKDNYVPVDSKDNL